MAGTAGPNGETGHRRRHGRRGGGGRVFLRLALGAAMFGLIYWMLGTFRALRRQGLRNRLRLLLAAMVAMWVTGMVLVPR